jgi:RNase P/RNase MRP subunit p30
MDGDIVLPKNNEMEFIEIAAKLGIQKLCFLYSFDGYNEEKIAKGLESAKHHKKLYVETGFLASHYHFGKTKHPGIIAAKSSEKDRMAMESGKIKVIYGFEELHRKDFLHQRASGLNHILCGLAKKNKVSIGFSYGMLLNKSPQMTSLLMGRMMQNIRLCRKFKVSTIMGSFARNPYELRQSHDIASLFRMMGMDSK